MLQGEVLIRELGAVDRLATGAIAGSEVAALAHEVLDHTVKCATLEVQRLPHLPRALLASAQGTEVLSGLGGDIRSELHHDTACSPATDGHVEEDLGVGHCCPC